MPAPASNSLLSRFLQSAERPAEVGLVVAVLGYVSLRSHFTQLGFSLTAGLGLENYLRETYSLLIDIWSALAEPFLFVAGNFWLLSIAAGAVALFLLAKKWLWPALLHPFWLRYGRAALAGLLGVLQFSLIQNLMSTALEPAQINMAVGALRRDAGRLHGELFFIASVWLCALAWIAWRQLPASAPRWLRQSVLVVTATQTLLLPIVDGLTVRDASFPVASVAAEGGREPECGLMVMATSSEIILWKASAGRGMAISVPAAKVNRVVSGEEQDLYQAIQEAAKTKAAHPSCAFATGGGQ